MSLSTGRLPKNSSIAIWITIFVSILIIVGIIKIRRMVTDSVFKTPWRTNIILVTNPLVVVSIPKNPQEKTLFVIIPTDVYLQVPWGYGYYELGKVGNLSEIENRPQLLSQSIEDVLHVNISTSLEIDSGKNSDKYSDNEIILQLKKSIPLLHHKKSDTAMSLYDRLQLLLKLKFLRPDSQQIYNITSESSHLSFATLRDGTQVKQLHEENIARFLGYYFEEDTIRKEGLLISIYNSTTTPNIAQKFVRYISVAGGKTISTGNIIREIDTCEVRSKTNLIKSFTVRFIVDKFNCNTVLTQEESTDVVVFVGNLFSDRWEFNQPLLLDPN